MRGAGMRIRPPVIHALRCLQTQRGSASRCGRNRQGGGPGWQKVIDKDDDDDDDEIIGMLLGFRRMGWVRRTMFSPPQQCAAQLALPTPTSMSYGRGSGKTDGRLAHMPLCSLTLPCLRTALLAYR